MPSDKAERYNPKYVIILSGDQICKQDYSDFLRFHKEKGAEFSVAVMEVPWEEAYVLIDCVRCSLIPVGSGCLLIRRQNMHASN